MQQDEWEKFRKFREEKAKSDLIGAIHNSEVYELLGFHEITTAGEKKSWDAFTEALGSVAGDAPVSKKNNVEDRVQDFGNEREETGFRLGFHTAMRLCMEGLNRGINV